MAHGLVSGLSGCNGAVLDFQAMLFQLLQAGADFFFLWFAEITRRAGKLIGALDDTHEIVHEALERGFLGNQVFIIKLHKSCF